jgi:hypothetical protein
MKMCWTTAAAVLLSVALSACGVGLTLGYGLGHGLGDDPPSVSLAAAPQSAAPGERIGLVAAASDDFVVREVLFYRVDARDDTLLGRDSSAPYAIETTVPTGTAGEVRYFAIAVDDAGQETRSQDVTVSVGAL